MTTPPSDGPDPARPAPLARLARAAQRELALAAFVALAALGCSTLAPTSVESSWKAPANEFIHFHKVVAVVMSPSEAIRRSGEDELVKLIQASGTDAVASYTLLPGDTVRDLDHARAVLQQAGCDGAVVMRPLGSEQVLTYVHSAFPGDLYYRPWSLWGPGWADAYAPGYLQTDTKVSVETLIYSLPKEQLLWAGYSKTTNPSGIQELVRSVAQAVGETLRDEKLIG